MDGTAELRLGDAASRGRIPAVDLGPYPAGDSENRGAAGAPDSSSSFRLAQAGTRSRLQNYQSATLNLFEVAVLFLAIPDFQLRKEGEFSA